MTSKGEMRPAGARNARRGGARDGARPGSAADGDVRQNGVRIQPPAWLRGEARPQAQPANSQGKTPSRQPFAASSSASAPAKEPPLFDGIAIACVASFAFLYISGIILNGLVYSRVAVYFGSAREIATVVGGLTYLCALLVARFRPEWLFVRRISAISVALTVFMAFLLIYALTVCDPAATVVALCIRAMVRAWAMTLAVASLVRVAQLKAVPLVVVAGLLLANICRPFMPLIDSPVAATIALSVVGLAPIALLTGIANPVLDRVRTDVSADVMELLQPGAFLKPSHGLFMCVLLFSAASGYAMTFGEVENAPVETGLFAFVLLLLAIYVFAVKGARQEDLLFSFSVVLTMAGFLMVPFTFDTESIAANTLLDIGENCFDALLWLMFAGVGRRNLFAMLPTFGLAEFCAAAGTDIGAVVGHVSNGLVHGDERMVIAFALILAFVFFVVLWVGFRKFSFTEVLEDMESERAASDDAPDDGPRKAEDAQTPLSSGLDNEDAQGGEDAGDTGRRMDTSQAGDDASAPAAFSAASSARVPAEGHADVMAQRCAALADEFGLTEREGEIFAMLARGRNARFIMEEFVLSRNTVKSHIKHIYAKLGVHSQQELIDLVEQGR